MGETIHSGTITLDSGGAATVYFPPDGVAGATPTRFIDGALAGWRYIKDLSTPFTGTTWTWTVEATGEPICTMSQLASSSQRYIRVQVHDTAGVAITGVYDMIAISKSRVKLVISGGTPGQLGTFFVVVA